MLLGKKKVLLVSGERSPTKYCKAHRHFLCCEYLRETEEGEKQREKGAHQRSQEDLEDRVAAAIQDDEERRLVNLPPLHGDRDRGGLDLGQEECDDLAGGVGDRHLPGFPVWREDPLHYHLSKHLP